MTSLRKKFHRNRHLALLIALLVMASVQPLAHGSPGGLVVFDFLLSVVLVGIVGAIFKRRRDRLFALVLAAMAVATRFGAYALDEEFRLASRVTHQVVVIGFLTFAIITILRGIFEEEDIRADHFVGTICGYLLAGVAWGNCYTIADLMIPGAFRVAPQIAEQLAHEHLRSFYFNYFSLCAITGAGFGDITPVDPFVATLAWLEAGFGQFYIAVVVAQLVGMAFSRAVTNQ